MAATPARYPLLAEPNEAVICEAKAEKDSYEYIISPNSSSIDYHLPDDNTRYEFGLEAWPSFYVDASPPSRAFLRRSP
jgi:hypothetical protein